MTITPIQHARQIIQSKGLSVSQVEKDLGWGNGSLQESKSKSMSYERAIALANYLDVSHEFLMTGKERQPDNKLPELSNEAIRVGRDYDKLDALGQEVVRSVISVEQRRTAVNAPVSILKKTIPLFGQSVAAGYGEPDFGNMWEEYEVPENTDADFAVRIHGDSMKPYLNDGSIAFGVKREPKGGETGVFLVDGEFLVKQYCADMRGDVFLFSLNRKYKDADRRLMVEQEHQFLCFGTILLKKLPLPTDIGV